MKTNFTYQSMFNYGEVGDSLNGFRNSEISMQSAKSIKNFYVSEMGTLRVAKKYEEHKLIADARANEYIIYKLNTKYNFFLVFTKSRILSFNKETLTQINSREISTGSLSELDEFCNINIFNDFIFIKDKNKNVSVFAINENGEIGTTNFFDTIELPFQQKQDVAFDIYKCFSIDNKIRPELMTSIPKDGELKIDSNGDIFLKNSGLKIDRVYEQYKSVIAVDQLDGAVAGTTILVFKNFQASKGNLSYHLKNTKINFTNRTIDNKYGSYYYTKAEPINTEGKLIFGVLEDFVKDKTKIIDVVEFQSRLAIATADKIYFSKILDYNNFVPSLEAEAGFFIKPFVIDGNQPNIKKLVVGNGLYISCTEGIIVAGYGSSINGINMSNIHIAGNSQPTDITTLIEDIFYYVDRNGLLRAIVPDFQSGVIRFSNIIVEKYDFSKHNIKYISKGTVNEDNSLIVTRNNGNTMKIYNSIGDGLFRKIGIEFDLTYPIFGFNDDIISGTTYYKLTDNNMDSVEVILNMPFIENEKGIYLNDYSSSYRKIVSNIYAQNKQAIKKVSINNEPMQNLGDTSKGDHSIYSFMGTVPIIDLTISIETRGTTDTIEIRGINGFLAY